MTWRDKIRNAGVVAFRGAEFYVSTSGRESGRRVVVHSFPGRDDVETEDLGRLPRRFELNGFVIGDDAMARRDVIINAFEQPGPGQLVHPYYGPMQAVADGPVRVTESMREGRIARFSVSMIRVDDQVPTVPQVDTIAKVESAANGAIHSATWVFGQKFDVDGLIQAFRDSAVATIQNAASSLRSANSSVAGRLSVINDTAAALDSLSNSAGTLIDTPASVSTSITSVGASVLGAVAQVESATSALLDAGSMPTEAQLADAAAKDAEQDRRRSAVLVDVLRGLMAFGDAESATNETTPQRAQEKKNQDVIVRLQRTSSIVESCRSSVSVPLESRTQAIELRDELLSYLDELIDSSDDDIEHQALFDLRVAVAQHLTTVSAGLPDILTYTPPATLPALVIAHSLYGDATRDLDLIARNSIRHPGFVTGGVGYEVLSA